MGGVDDARVYNYALTAPEIAALATEVFAAWKERDPIATAPGTELGELRAKDAGTVDLAAGMRKIIDSQSTVLSPSGSVFFSLWRSKVTRRADQSNSRPSVAVPGLRSTKLSGQYRSGLRSTDSATCSGFMSWTERWPSMTTIRPGSSSRHLPHSSSVNCFFRLRSV